MSAPRPFETYPFHPHSSVHILRYDQFLYKCSNVPVMSSMWYDIGTMYLANAHALSHKHSTQGSEPQVVIYFCLP